MFGFAALPALLAAAGAASAGGTSCLDKAKSALLAAGKQDDAAYKVAVSRCQETYPPASKTTQFVGCVTGAARTHEDHRKKLLEEYKKAVDLCGDRIGACMAQLYADQKKAAEQAITKYIVDSGHCKSAGTYQQMLSCQAAAEAAYGQAMAALPSRNCSETP